MKAKMTKGRIREIISEEVRNHCLRKRLNEALEDHKWDIRIRPGEAGVSVGLMKDEQFIDVKPAKNVDEVAQVVTSMLAAIKQESGALTEGFFKAKEVEKK